MRFAEVTEGATKTSRTGHALFRFQPVATP